MKKTIMAIAGAGLLTAACASDPYGYGGGYGTNETVRQGAIGAAIGAAAGQLLGGDTESTVAGAAVGGAIGAIRGSSRDRANQQRHRAANGQYYYCYDNRQTECYWEDGTRVRW